MASSGDQGYSSYNQSAGYYTSSNVDNTSSNVDYSEDGYYDSQYDGSGNQYTGGSNQNPSGGSWQYGGTLAETSSAGYSGYSGGESNGNPYGFSDWGSGRGRGGKKRKYGGNTSESWSGQSQNWSQGGNSGNWSQGGNSGNWSEPSGGNNYYGANADYSGWYGGDYDQSRYDDYDMEGDYGYNNTSNTKSYGGRKSYRGNPKNPFRQRGAGSNTYHRVWRKGMPLWEGISERQIFKRKYKKKFVAFDNVKNEVENELGKERADAKLSRKKSIRAARVKNFKKTIALKKKYRSVKQNKNLTFNDQLVLIFLKRIAYEMCEGEDDLMVHCLNFSKLASRHPNALKIFAYEAKIQMDRKYDTTVEGTVEKRKAYLAEARDEIIAGFQKVYKHRSDPEDIGTKTALIDEYIGIVSGETFNPELHVPTDDDLVLNKNHSRKEEDFVSDIKYEFLFYCYESFRLKVDEQKRRTKSLIRRLKFHWDNKILPFLLVEHVRAKTFASSLPEPLSKYLSPQSSVHQERNTSLLNMVLEQCTKNKEMVVTPITKYLVPGTEYSAKVQKDFADCITLFDKFATYARYRMTKYTPHILLPTEMKDNLFNELLDRIYREALEILVKNERMESTQFEDMTADPEELEKEIEREAQRKKEMEMKEAERKAQDEEMKEAERKVQDEVKDTKEGETNKDVNSVVPT